VNEIADRTWDDEAGKKTVVTRMSEGSVVAGFVYSMVIVYGVVVVGALTRIMPLSALIALFTVPVALKVRGLIKDNLGNPYGLIPAMALNIRLYVFTAVLLIVGYLLSFLLRI
jgi:1,4-dihydroxy-2-naphthoate octaprenyltransferase